MIRLFVTGDLVIDGEVSLSAEQSHYVSHVMRLDVGDRLAVFNGRDGEWRAWISVVRKKEILVTVEARLREQAQGQDVELIVALVKRAPLEMIVEKATELGVRRMRPVITERTNAGHTNVARLTAIAVEAAEQCGRLEVPMVCEPERLSAVLDRWDGARRLMFCDEAGDAAPASQALAQAGCAAWAILIGPEGGFSLAERSRIRETSGAVPVSLGPRILRADTAAIAALTVWQATLGDWRGT